LRRQTTDVGTNRRNGGRAIAAHANQEAGVTRYKQYGQMLVIEPPPKAVEEVSVRELSRDTSSVLARLVEGRRAVVTSRGTPVAVILEVEEAVGLCATVLLSRQAAERRLFGPELDQQLRERSARRDRRILDRPRKTG
jgi:prevent-host-death family protein